MKKSSCRGCGAEIVWIHTKACKNMPCNAEPVLYWKKAKASGKVVTKNGEIVSCDFEGDIDTATGLGYISHFATCSKAGSFRRGK